MADETVDIDVNVNGADEAAGKFTRLQVQIRETQKALQAAQEAGDSVKFNQLKGQLDELEDKLEVTQLKSKQFDDTLAALPGPAGKAGQAIKGLDGAFKLIAANPVVATIAGLSALFLALRESLSRTEEGTKALSRITEGFERILNALFAVLEPIAFAFADLIGSLLENKTVMTALGKVVAVLGGTFSALFSTVKALGTFVVGNFINAFKSLTGVLAGVGKVIKGVFTFDFDAIKEGVSQVKDTVVTGFTTAVENVKKVGSDIVTAVTDDFMKGFNAAEASFTEGSKRLTKKEREEKKKRDEQAAKDAADAAKKLAEAKKEADKVILEAELSLLEERQRKLKERELKFNEDKAKLIAAGITDFTVLEKAYREDVLDINKEFDTKEAEERKKKDEEARKKREEELKKQLDAEILALDTKKAQGLINEEEYQAALLQIKSKYAQDEQALGEAQLAYLEYNNKKRDEYAKQVEAINKATAESYITLANSIGTSLNNVAQLFEKGSTAAKVFGILSVVVNAASGIAQAIMRNQEAQASYNKTIAEGTAGIASGTILLTNPITAGLGVARIAASKAAIAAATAGKITSKINTAAQIATISATSAAQIAAISSAKKESASATGGAVGAGSGGGGGAAAAAVGGGISISAPQIGATASQSGTIAGIVAGTLQQNQSQGLPIRAYVVGNEVTTQQQLDRRIRTAARLGG